MLQRFGFAKQLTIYLLAVLILAFIFISWALTNSVQQFIGTNAYNQAQKFTENLQKEFEKEILKIEDIPDRIIHTHGQAILENYSTFPDILMKTHSQLVGCAVFYNTINSKNPFHVLTSRQPDGSIEHEKMFQTTFRPPATGQIIRQNSQGGYWIYSRIHQIPTLAYCHPLYKPENQYFGYLKLDFPIQTILDIIHNNKFYEYGHLFIIDSLGNYLSQPDLSARKDSSCLAFLTRSQNDLHLKQKIIQGETGSSIYYKNNIKYFVYYSPLPCMNWRLGIICPYNATLYSSHNLYLIIFLCLGGGLLFLFVGIINIVHLLSFPLKQLAYKARQIADGQFNIEIPAPNSSSEVNELYASFRYMQRSLINYIEKLKISTIEKEQRNSEMNLARRIQQRFLPQHIELPSNIQLAAELRQSREVGGDLYEFFILGNRLYFAIGDVSGKGTPAALYMVSVSKLFRYVASTETSTAKICNIINKHMCEDTEDDMYVTMFMGILDINTGVMTYTNAGHPYPLVIHENYETNFFTKYPDVPIGILEDHNFSEHTYTVHKNHSILFYTDGITDTENPAGQFYGKENLIACVQRVACQSPQEIIEAILEDITIHMNTRKQSDDLSLLVIRFTGATSPTQL